MSTGPKEAELQAIKAAFDMFDPDGDGTITTEELKTVLKGLGQECDETEIIDFIAEADTDGNGTVDFQEFSRLVLLEIESNREEDELVNAFRVFDHENSSYLSTAELKHALKTLNIGLSNNEIEEMLIEADFKGDGVINYEDFAKIIVPKKKTTKTANLLVVLVEATLSVMLPLKASLFALIYFAATYKIVEWI